MCLVVKFPNNHKPTHMILSILLGMWGRWNGPKDVLIPRICDYLALHGKRDLADITRVTYLKQVAYPGLFSEPKSNEMNEPLKAENSLCGWRQSNEAKWGCQRDWMCEKDLFCLCWT